MTLVSRAVNQGVIRSSKPLILNTVKPSIRHLSIDSIQESLTNGSFTSEDLVRTYLAKIAEVNPTIHAVAEINPDALAIAQALDKERTLEGPRGCVRHPMNASANKDSWRSRK